MLKKKFLNIKKPLNPTKTIIAFHGILSDSHFNPQLEEIAKELNYEYISYTFPGHADHHVDKMPTVNELVEVAIEVVQLASTNKIILVGHSAGANWATRCIPYFGEECFEKLILISPLNSSIKILNNNKLKIFTDTIIKDKANLGQKILQQFDNAKMLVTEYSRREAMQYVMLVVEMCKKSFLLNNNLIYEKLKLPTLIISGDLDVIIDTFDSFKTFKRVNPKIDYRIMTDAGHSNFLDKPEEFKQIVKDFLMK